MESPENPLSSFTGNYERNVYRDTRNKYVLRLKDTPEEFRSYLEATGVVAACRYVKATRDVSTLGNPYRDFVNHLHFCIETLQNGGRRDLLFVLMELYLPWGAYADYLERWVRESDLDLFKLLVQQGHSLYEFKRYVETTITRYGRIDVLDFFLASEGEVRILHDDIVYEACRHHNVDVLDRVLVRGYPVNVPCKLSETLPIYAAIHDDTSILDRLIMYGADVNVVDKGKGSPLVFSFKQENFDCLNRLVDVGARIDNERDIPTIFGSYVSNREAFLKLIEAGLDLQYRSNTGTPLEIIESQKSFCTDSIGRPDLQYLKPRELLQKYCEVERIVRDLIAEQGK